MPTHRLRTIGAAVLVGVLLAACTSQPSPAPSSSAAATSISPSAGAPSVGTASATTPSATAGLPPASEVRGGGTRVRANDATAWVVPADGVTMTRKKADDGSLHLTFRDTRAEATDEPLAYVTGSHVRAFADGSALVGGGGMTPTGASLRASSDDEVLALSARESADAPTVWFAGTAVVDTSWGNREGGRSLAVTPSDWARAGGLAAADLIWSQLVAAEPEADSTTMHDQLSCHELGAPEKAAWNLEPWRPEVDGLTMIAARCNPT